MSLYGYVLKAAIVGAMNLGYPKCKTKIKRLADLSFENTFMKKIAIIAISVSFLFVSCKQPKKEIQSSPGIPESPGENSSSEISFSKSRTVDLVERIYAELLEKNKALNELEKTIVNLKEQKEDSLQPFKIFDQKNLAYYNSTGHYIANIRDSLLRIKITTIIDNSLTGYNRRIAPNKDFISTLDMKDTHLGDLHLILKLIKTLPIIEKYQAENTPSVRPVENVIRHFDKAIQQADSVAWE